MLLKLLSHLGFVFSLLLFQFCFLVRYFLYLFNHFLFIIFHSFLDFLKCFRLLFLLFLFSDFILLVFIDKFQFLFSLLQPRQYEQLYQKLTINLYFFLHYYRIIMPKTSFLFCVAFHSIKHFHFLRFNQFNQDFIQGFHYFKTNCFLLKNLKMSYLH